MAKSKISWTEKTWNPIRGCSKVSEGCKHCYAERMAARFCGEGQWTGEARFILDMLDAPLRWKKPSLVFVNSMSDLFHESLTFGQIAAVYGIIAACPQHTFQALTKRAARMVEFYKWVENHSHWSHPMQDALCEHPGPLPGLDHDDTGGVISTEVGGRGWPLSNLHLGVSVENQRAADERIPLLKRCPAAVRWVSGEPLLGHVKSDLNGINWVVVGGESGPNARPMHPEWVRALRDQCSFAGVPFFFKQWGEYVSTYDRDVEDPDWRKCSKVEKDGPGQWLNLDGGQGFHGKRVHWMKRAGKKNAGNLLDGVRHEMRPGDTWST
jgi:protein gp37